MKILYVAPLVPHPRSHGGRMRVAALLAALDRRADVHLLVVTDEPGTEARDYLRTRGADLWAAPTQTRLARGRRIVAASLAGRSIPAARLFSRGSIRQLAAKAAALSPDLVILGETFLAEPVAALRAQGLRVVIDTFNVESLLWRDVAKVAGSLPSRLGYSLLAANTAALERRTFRLAERVWAVSDEDAAWYRDTLGLAAVDVVPNVLDAGPALGPPDEPDAVVFVGVFDYLPNLDAALRLLTISRELVTRGVPHHLYLVGRRPSATLKVAAAALPHVTITGEVPSVEPWLQKAAVVAAPLQAGSGTKYKILEAMLAGRAVVTTQVGARGLGLVNGRHALIANLDGFADALATLLGDEALRTRLAAAARQHALERFTEAALETALDRALAPF